MSKKLIRKFKEYQEQNPDEYYDEIKGYFSRGGEQLIE